MYRWNQLRTSVVREGTGPLESQSLAERLPRPVASPRFPFSPLTLLQKYSRTFHGAEEYFGGHTLRTLSLRQSTRSQSITEKSVDGMSVGTVWPLVADTGMVTGSCVATTLPTVTFGLPVIRQESTSRSRDAFARQYEFESAFEEIFLQVSCTRGLPLM
jgi:hypothetical protein